MTTTIRTKASIAQDLLKMATELLTEVEQERAQEQQQGQGQSKPPLDHDDDQMIKLPEAAKILGISEDTLRRLVARNEVPHYPMPGSKTDKRKHVLFLRSELVAMRKTIRVS